MTYLHNVQNLQILFLSTQNKSKDLVRKQDTLVFLRTLECSIIGLVLKDQFYPLNSL